MLITPIIDNLGIELSRLSVDDTITDYYGGRVCKGEKSFYKGIGTHYHSHFLLNPDTRHYEILGKSPVDYMGYQVINPRFHNRWGIFLERYQPQFTDYIGTCGVKELSIIENSIEFGRSSVEVLKSHHIGLINSYWFELNYKCNRVGYLSYQQPTDLFDLMKYMIENDWNMIWDKDSITDISHNGLVTDVADIFKSSELVHKIGTIYSILYSLNHHDIDGYMNFIRSLRLSHNDQRYFIINAIEILGMLGVDVAELREMSYNEVVLNYLIQGRNCGHCVIEGLGEQIRKQYEANARAAFKRKV